MIIKCFFIFITVLKFNFLIGFDVIASTGIKIKLIF